MIVMDAEHAAEMIHALHLARVIAFIGLVRIPHCFDMGHQDIFIIGFVNQLFFECPWRRVIGRIPRDGIHL